MNGAASLLSKPASFPLHLVSDPVAAAAFLESIALLELLGARWMLAVPFAKWDQQIHGHAADEIRHTKMIQDAAKKLRWVMEPGSLVREASLSRAYYQATESFLSLLSKRVFLQTKRVLREEWSVPAYVILAFLIERRIMKIYPHLAHHGATEELKIVAREIISDERAHLSMVGDRLPASLEAAGLSHEEMVSMEEELARVWLEKLTRAES